MNTTCKADDGIAHSMPALMDINSRESVMKNIFIFFDGLFSTFFFADSPKLNEFNHQIDSQTNGQARKTFLGPNGHKNI